MHIYLINNHNHSQKFKVNSAEHCSHCTEKTKDQEKKEKTDVFSLDLNVNSVLGDVTSGRSEFHDEQCCQISYRSNFKQQSWGCFDEVIPRRRKNKMTSHIMRSVPDLIIHTDVVTGNKIVIDHSAGEQLVQTITCENSLYLSNAWKIPKYWENAKVN